MPKALITTVPFASKSDVPIGLLENAGIDYVINPYLLKVFFFFTDCDLDNGPHEYIQGSHNRFDVLNNKRYYEDSDIDSLYPEGSEERVVSKVTAGTVVIEDTRGVHRARMPVTGYRDLGFAIFVPVNSTKNSVYNRFPQDAYNKLTDFQRAFVPPHNVE